MVLSPAVESSAPWTLPNRRQAWRMSMLWILLASFTLHLGITALLTVLPFRRFAEVPVERSISVDVLSESQFEAATAPPKPEPEVVAPQPAITVKPEETPAKKEPMAEPQPQKGMVQATHLYAADVLKEPASKEVRETLPLLAAAERMTQLCNIEALEQIPQWDRTLRPDTLIAYATADTRVTGHAIEADGGAFRSNKQWYRIKFRCEVAADFQSVTAFQFEVGEAIPKSEWDAGNLPDGGKDED